jgi:hypothetical protein
MNTHDSLHDSGSAAGRETAPEGKDPDGPGPGGVAAEGKDGWEGCGGDEGGWTATEARYDELEGTGTMKEDADDIPNHLHSSPHPPPTFLRVALHPNWAFHVVKHLHPHDAGRLETCHSTVTSILRVIAERINDASHVEGNEEGATFVELGVGRDGGCGVGRARRTWALELWVVQESVGILRLCSLVDITRIQCDEQPLMTLRNRARGEPLQMMREHVPRVCDLASRSLIPPQVTANFMEAVHSLEMAFAAGRVEVMVAGDTGTAMEILQGLRIARDMVVAWNGLPGGVRGRDGLRDTLLRGTLLKRASLIHRNMTNKVYGLNLPTYADYDNAAEYAH